MGGEVNNESSRTAREIIDSYGKQAVDLEDELKSYTKKGEDMSPSDMLEVQRLLNQLSQLTGITTANLAKLFEMSDKIINKL